MAVHPPADFYPLFRRQLFDGFFDFGERAHGGMVSTLLWQGKGTANPGGYDCFLEMTGALEDERAAITAG